MAWQGECFELLNPFERLGSAQRSGELVYDCDVKLLEHLGRESEIEFVNQPERLPPLDCLLAAPCRRIDQDIGIEEGLNAHAVLRGSTSASRPGQLTAR